LAWTDRKVRHGAMLPCNGAAVDAITISERRMVPAKDFRRGH
jgi:hypothetical protein